MYYNYVCSLLTCTFDMFDVVLEMYYLVCPSCRHQVQADGSFRTVDLCLDRGGGYLMSLASLMLDIKVQLWDPTKL